MGERRPDLFQDDEPVLNNEGKAVHLCQGEPPHTLPLTEAERLLVVPGLEVALVPPRPAVPRIAVRSDAQQARRERSIA